MASTRTTSARMPAAERGAMVEAEGRAAAGEIAIEIEIVTVMEIGTAAIGTVIESDREIENRTMDGAKERTETVEIGTGIGTVIDAVLVIASETGNEIGIEVEMNEMTTTEGPEETLLITVNEARETMRAETGQEVDRREEEMVIIHVTERGGTMARMKEENAKISIKRGVEAVKPRAMKAPGTEASVRHQKRDVP